MTFAAQIDALCQRHRTFVMSLPSFTSDLVAVRSGLVEGILCLAEDFILPCDKLPIERGEPCFGGGLHGLSQL